MHGLHAEVLETLYFVRVRLVDVTASAHNWKELS
jgi:hypothetical protein